jgi:RND superfamily putative drug exporter
MIGEGVNCWRVVRPVQFGAGVWRAIAHTILRHSVAAIAFVLAIVVVLSSPFTQAHFGLGDASIIPKTITSRQGIEVMRQAFGAGEPTPILLLVSTQNPTAPILTQPHIATLYHLVQDLQRDSRIASIDSLFNLNPSFSLETYQQLYSRPELLSSGPLSVALDRLSSHSTMLLLIKSRTDNNSAASHTLVKTLRQLSFADLRVQVGGQIARQLDTIQIVSQRFPIVLAAILTVTFIVLCALLGSVVLPLKAIAMNLLSMGASFGALVFIFQEGHLQNLLDFSPLGYLDILLTVVMFCVLFGLSMDYEVFLLCRIKESYDQCQDNRQSIVEGLERTGQIITSAALLLIIVTGAFAFTSIIFVKALGLGVAVGVLIDVTIIRTVLVPASMNLLGTWNWWAPKCLHLEWFKLEMD